MLNLAQGLGQCLDLWPAHATLICCFCDAPIVSNVEEAASPYLTYMQEKIMQIA